MQKQTIKNKNHYSIFTLIQLLFLSSRPITWMRIWSEMIIPASVAATYAQSANIPRFIIAYVCTSPLLWSASYMLNDITDLNLDKDHSLRSTRPISSGKMSISTAMYNITICTGLSLFISAFLDARIFILLLGLIGNEVLYTIKPFRFKERPILDVINNAVNSLLRTFIAWFSQTHVVYPAILPISVMMVLIKVLLFLGHRYQNRDFEVQHSIISTIYFIPQKYFKILIVILTFCILFLGQYLIQTKTIPVISLIAFPIGLLPLGIFILYKSHSFHILHEEKNEFFRMVLYLSLFIMSTVTAVFTYWR